MARAEFQDMLEKIQLGPSSVKDGVILNLIKSEKSLSKKCEAKDPRDVHPQDRHSIFKLPDLGIRILSGLTSFEIDHQKTERPRGLSRDLTIYFTQHAIYINNISRGHFGLAVESESVYVTLVIPISRVNVFISSETVKIQEQDLKVKLPLFIDIKDHSSCERIIKDLRLTELLDINKKTLSFTFLFSETLTGKLNPFKFFNSFSSKFSNLCHGFEIKLIDSKSTKEKYLHNLQEETKLVHCSKSFDDCDDDLIIELIDHDTNFLATKTNLKDIEESVTENEIRAKKEGKNTRQMSTKRFILPKPERFDEYTKLWREFQDMLKTIRLGPASKEDPFITSLIKCEMYLAKIPHQVVKLSCTKVHIWSYVCNHSGIQVYCTQRAIFIVNIPQPSSEETITLVIPIVMSAVPNVSIKLTKIKGKNVEDFNIDDLHCVHNDEVSETVSKSIGGDDDDDKEHHNDLTCHFLLLEKVHTDDQTTCDRIRKDLNLEKHKYKSGNHYFDGEKMITLAPLCPFKSNIEYELSLLKKFYGKIISEIDCVNYEELYMNPIIECNSTTTVFYSSDFDSSSESDDQENEESTSNNNANAAENDIIRAKKRKKSENNTDMDFESYINGVKENKLPRDFFIRIMKDLTTNDPKKSEKLNTLLLNEWMQSIEENNQLKAEIDRLKQENEAMDVLNNHSFEHENIEIKQEPSVQNAD